MKTIFYLIAIFMYSASFTKKQQKKMEKYIMKVKKQYVVCLLDK